VSIALTRDAVSVLCSHSSRSCRPAAFNEPRPGARSNVGFHHALLDDFSSERVRIGCMAFLLAIVAAVLLAAWLRIPPF
jgi:hypothetical protein